jgi:crotonobetaine/carnitine-CoA ligase
LFHVNAQTWALCSVLGVGATAVLMPKWSSSRFWEVVERQAITHISMMPFCLSTLMTPDRPDTALRVGVFGLIMPEGPQLFGLDVYAAYGMTETVIHAISGKPADNLPTRSMGRVTAGYELAIVDKDTGDLSAEGETGELWLRGTRGIQLFLEYFENPEANQAAFQDGWFKTGDMVKMAPDGSVSFVERSNDLLKVGGENVSAREVEETIAAVDGVTKAAVVARRDDFLDQVVVAFVTKAPDVADDAALIDRVMDRCTGDLSKFKVPRAVYIIDEIPMGELGKVLKNRLREMAEALPPL